MIKNENFSGGSAEMRKYQICKRCIMDTTDPEITFDDNGICNHCHSYEEAVNVLLDSGSKELQLKKIVNKIKNDEKDKEYDCVLGISGGVDSAYLAYLAHSLGLRVLAVHVDAGWNSEIAVQNIQKICSKLKYDLHTIVVDWPTMKELQRAYMFSGLPNLDVPQDHVFLASVYKYARKHKIKYILSGGNLATEGILPKAWVYSNVDFINIKDVYKKNRRSNKSLCKYPHLNWMQYIWYNYSGKVKSVRLLNYIDYSKKSAIDTLEREFGWQYYGGKHFESRFTKFFQSYYLPVKFGYDKRRAHLSSLIVSGEISREEALDEMENKNAYLEQEMLADKDYILKKLEITEDEWEGIMNAPNKTEYDYKNDKRLMDFFRRFKDIKYLKRKREV